MIRRDMINTSRNVLPKNVTRLTVIRVLLNATYAKTMSVCLALVSTSISSVRIGLHGENEKRIAKKIRFTCHTHSYTKTT